MGVIRVTFAPNGAVAVKPEGFAGEACRAATALYLRRQAGKIVTDRPTDEADQAKVAAPEERLRQ